jgi:hypothetical protein
MIRSLSCTCILVGAALTIAAASNTPGDGPQNEKANLQPQNATQPPSPHAIFPHGNPQRTNEERRGMAPQPGRIEYSYPLKGDQERSKSVKALQQLTVDLLALHNMYKGAHLDLTGPLYLQLHE